MRARITHALAVIAIAAAPAAGLIVTSAAPAGAAQGGLCELFSTHYCAGADDLNTGTPVMENNPPGRTMRFNPDANGVGTLQFTGATNRCLGINLNQQQTSVRVCSGVDTILWTQVFTNGNARYINNYDTRQTGISQYLTGLGSLHQPFQTEPLQCPGLIGSCLQAFTDITG